MEENVPRDLLETMGHSVEWIALHVGFGSPTNLRYGFERLVRTSPRAYPRAAQIRQPLTTEFLLRMESLRAQRLGSGTAG